MAIAKPVSLIVSNVMHEAAEGVRHIDKIVKAARKMLPKTVEFDIPDIPTDVARKLLCEIAHEAHASIVFKALESIGAPSTPDMISEGLQAVKDMQ